MNYKLVPLKSESSLLECYVTIEGNKKVHSGKVTFVEGEIFEVEVPQSKYYEPGDNVKVIIYTKEGMVFFHTSVIAQGFNEIFLLFPPDVLRQILRRRQFPRIEVPLVGKLEQMDLPIDIHNVSEGGIGFSSTHNFSRSSILTVTIQLDKPLTFNLEIIHNQVHTESNFYGGSFKDASPNEMIGLRTWILRKQIERRIEEKQDIAAALTEEG